MSFFNEKWKNSSIMTKAAAWILAFTSLLLLICTVTMTLVRETVGAGTVDTAVAATSAGMGFAARMFADALLPLIPAAVLVRIGFYLFVFTTPMVFYVLATLILLLFCGKDFRRKKEMQSAT